MMSWFQHVLKTIKLRVKHNIMWVQFTESVLIYIQSAVRCRFLFVLLGFFSGPFPIENAETISICLSSV